jgi:ribosomal protein S27AE
VTLDYPKRPMAPNVVRYACMIFGLANVAGSIAYTSRQDMFMLIGGLLVGGGWFAFGKYGGLPLVSTVADWRPPSSSGEIEEIHRQGLLVMRRRRWIVWAAIPGTFVVAALLIPLLMQGGHPEIIVLLLGVPLAFISFRYYLSRCPRCSFGFFTRSASRAALLRLRNTCGHCGLSLYAYKKP